MKKVRNLVILVTSICLLAGCGSIDVPLDEDYVESYLEDATIPENVEVVYEDEDGVSYLMNLKENASTFAG